MLRTSGSHSGKGGEKAIRMESLGESRELRKPQECSSQDLAAGL